MGTSTPRPGEGIEVARSLIHSTSSSFALDSSESRYCPCYANSVNSCCDADSATSVAQLGAPEQRNGSSTWRRGSTTLAAILVALLPKCPACWSAYAGLSSLLGLSFVVEARYLLPLTAGLLSLAVGALAHKAQRSGGYGPCVLGLVASGGVLIGKFGVESALLMHASVGALVLATLWSSGLGAMLRRRLPSLLIGSAGRVARRRDTSHPKVVPGFARGPSR